MCCSRYFDYLKCEKSVDYTPGIYAEGYIVFAFRLFVHSFVCDSIMYVEFTTKF